MKKTFLLFILVILETVSVSAQLYRYLDTNQGLSSRRVIAIEKDTKGYMWFLTHEGVDRYNGKQFIHYPLLDGKRPIQQPPNLSNLQIDDTGNIWVIGKNGYIFKYNSHQNKYDLIMNFADSLQTTRRLPLTFAGIDHDNRIWLCTRNAQYIYHISNQQTVKLDSPIQEEITFLEQGGDNEFFIGTNHNIYLAHLSGNQLIVRREPKLENFNIVQHIYYHPYTNQLLIGTLADGFYVFDFSTWTLKNIGQLKDVTMNNVVQTSHSEEEVLIATDGNGVFKMNMRTLELLPFLSSNHQISSRMNGDIIKDIYADKEGRIWMAVFPISITIYSDHYPTYQWIHNIHNHPNSLANNQITSILEDSDGDLWVTTTNGIGYYNTRTQQWKTLLSSRENNWQEQNYVFVSLCETTPGTIAIGGYMSGMYYINKKDMRPQYFSPQSQGYTDIRPDKYIRSIYRDEEGFVWAGGYYNFKRLNANGQIEHYATDYPITFITSKNDYELWVGTANGIYKFNKIQKKLQQVNLSSDIGTINYIYQADSIMTYIGTHGTGLWIYNNVTRQLENFQTHNSALISNNIFCILPSQQPEELIISTENELVSFNTKERFFLNWTQEQGLLVNKFNTSAGVKTRDGNIILGSDEGLIVIKDSIKFPRTIQSKLVFSNFNIQYQEMLPKMKGSPLQVPIDETQSITLSHDQNIFSLDVSSINYDCPSRVLYSWKLEGFFNEWTNPSETHLIRYTGLTPGNYTLKVRSILLDDGRTLEERHLRITIAPPFSQTWGAYLIYTLIFLIIIFAIIRYIWLRKDSIISREKIQFFIHIAHDIRTPLTLIKGPLSEISRTETLSEQGKNNLQAAIQNTDRLTELTNKLIDFQKEELYASKLHVTLVELNNYLKSFLVPFQTYAEKKQLQLSLEGTTEPLEAWIDQNKIDSIIYNLISNALKYTPEGGKVSLHLQGTSSEWTLQISDTGIGIPAAEQKKMFKHLFRGKNAINQRITGTGIGMLQTYRLTKHHLGRISVSSKENTGTTFLLHFPIDSPQYIRQTDISVKETGIHYRETGETSKPYTHIFGTYPTNAPQILIVEDNPDLRFFLHQSLSENYRIKEAENGKEALEQIAKEQPDLVISDIMMPEMRGDELCQTLKSQMETSHIPVILLTALGDKESILHGLDIKADSYVVKPFDMDILKANIASILANKEFLRQRFAQLDYRTEDLPKEVQEAPGLSLDQEFLIKVTETVKKNLGKEFNVDDLCQEMGMSRSSLYNKIKALTDRSPSDFVRQIRMAEASILLKSKKFTVSEISDKLGYSDPKYFTDIFKKHYGMTPSAYMKQT